MVTETSVAIHSLTESFIFAAISQLRGDPHITTLDDLTYTFNGHGEFILVESTSGTNFMIQVSLQGLVSSVYAQCFNHL